MKAGIQATFFARDGCAFTAKISVNVFHFINSVFPERSRNGLKLKSACHVAWRPHSPRRSFQTFRFEKLSHHVTHFERSIEINSRNVSLLAMQTFAALSLCSSQRKLIYISANNKLDNMMMIEQHPLQFTSSHALAAR